VSNTAAGTSFHSLSELCLGLKHLDRLRGLPYGAASPKKLLEDKTSDTKHTSRMTPKSIKTVGHVASVTDDHDGSLPSPYVMHQEAWVGAINLTEEQGRNLHSMFKCPQCHCNTHTLPTCPLMKNWITKKLQPSKSDSQAETTPSGTARSAVLSTSDTISKLVADTNASGLDPIPEDFESDDFESEVEFDLLTPSDNQNITATNGTHFMYTDLMVSLGLVYSATSSQLQMNPQLSTPCPMFDLIIDSGYTRHMMPYRQAFTTYKICKNSMLS
jgi:hypothetical protein